MLDKLCEDCYFVACCDFYLLFRETDEKGNDEGEFSVFFKLLDLKFDYKISHLDVKSSHF